MTPEPVRALNTKPFDFQVSLKIIFLILWDWGDNTKTKFGAYINAILTSFYQMRVLVTRLILTHSLNLELNVTSSMNNILPPSTSKFSSLFYCFKGTYNFFQTVKQVLLCRPYHNCYAFLCTINICLSHEPLSITEYAVFRIVPGTEKRCDK